MRLAISALAVLCQVGCNAYQPGAFGVGPERWSGEHRTVGCVELAIDRPIEPAAAGPAVSYAFGNRCDHPAEVDLGAVVARGRTAAGQEVALAPYDPAGEIRRGQLDARSSGRETIEYVTGDRALVELCVDVGAISGGGPPAVACFAQGAGEVVVANP